jgi:hypothetical protein
MRAAVLLGEVGLVDNVTVPVPYSGARVLCYPPLLRGTFKPDVLLQSGDRSSFLMAAGSTVAFNSGFNDNYSNLTLLLARTIAI